jgi:hypothetical protein
MKVLVVVSVLACLFAATPAQQGKKAHAMKMMASDVIGNWKPTPKKAAMKMIAKYGQPDEVTDMRIVWHNNGPWKQTIIVNEEIDHRFPMAHKDCMEQTVNYKVTPTVVDELLRYDGSVIPERTKGELSARCDLEEANFLALNLANDVATKKRTVESARKFYSAAIKAMKAGKPSAEQKRYLSGLVFMPPKSMSGDPDRPISG